MRCLNKVILAFFAALIFTATAIAMADDKPDSSKNSNWYDQARQNILNSISNNNNSNSNKDAKDKSDCNSAYNSKCKVQGPSQ